MPAHVIDSAIYGDLFGTAEARRIFSDEHLVELWLRVEVALARAEAGEGLIPPEAAEAIARAARPEAIALEELRRGTAVVGYPILPLVRALVRACPGGMGEYVHWGATTQDIMDTALALQLTEIHVIALRDLRLLEDVLLDLATSHRATPMPGRTHGMQALPITFGYKVAVWAAEVRRHVERLEACRGHIAVGQFAGAVGTLASVGPRGLEVQRRFCEALGLAQPVIAWHTARDGVAAFACALGLVAATLGKLGQEVALLQRTEIGEVEEPYVPGKGASSTMPQKRNPILCESLIAIARLARQDVALALEAMGHDHERATGPWHVEWACVPRVCVLAAGALRLALDLTRGLVVHPHRMTRNLELDGGQLLAESVMMRLAPHVGRTRAHDLVYDACMEAHARRVPLRDCLLASPPIRQHLDAAAIDAALDPAGYLGLAEAFVDRVVAQARAARGQPG
jgi:3-carboxy-cis,cis-muconate cycloisomerase